MAAEILLEGADVSSMPVRYDEEPVHKYNEELCTELGIEVPEGYIKIV